jgi:hypothetical protein
LDTVLDVTKWLDEAKKAFLLQGASEFHFTLRRRGDPETFYRSLEAELRAWPQLKITRFRSVREGYVKIARPSQVSFSLSFLRSMVPGIDRDAEIVSKAFSYAITDQSGESLRWPEFWNQNYSLIVGNLDELVPSINIYQHLMTHRNELNGLRPREVSHGESSKLIGKSSLVLALLRWGFNEKALTWEQAFDKFGLIDQKQEIRFFAPKVQFRGVELRELHGIISEVQADHWSFDGVEGMVIIENYESFLSLAEKVQNHLLIWGQGWKIISMSSFLSRFDCSIHYWGDIDSEGLEIFLRLNAVLPKVQPLGMTLELLNMYSAQVQKLTDASSSEVNVGTASGSDENSKARSDSDSGARPSSPMNFLNGQVNSKPFELWCYLKTQALRLEQEKLAWFTEPDFAFLLHPADKGSQ